MRSTIFLLVSCAVAIALPKGFQPGPGDVVSFDKQVNEIPVAVDAFAFDEMMTFIRAKDTVGIDKLVAAKKVFRIKPTATAKIIEIKNGYTRLRMIDGPLAKEEAYTYYQFLGPLKEEVKKEAPKVDLEAEQLRINKSLYVSLFTKRAEIAAKFGDKPLEKATFKEAAERQNAIAAEWAKHYREAKIDEAKALKILKQGDSEKWPTK